MVEVGEERLRLGSSRGGGGVGVVSGAGGGTQQDSRRAERVAAQ